MKIIISPSKTQVFKQTNKQTSIPKYIDQSNHLAKQIRQLSKDDLSSIMKIKGNKLNDVFNHYQHFHENQASPAILSYTGLVYKGLDIDNYDEINFTYMNEHIRILSALYGVLNPMDGIKPYRLDLTMKLNLYNYWSFIQNEFKDDDCIINLASTEFSQMINHPNMVNIHFLEQRNGSYKNLSTYSKMARGLMLNFMIKQHITHIDDLKKFNLNQYTFNQELSSQQEIIFTR